MTKLQRIRVLCADDHPLIRDGIAYALHQERDMEMVAGATNGVDAVAAFRLYRPDVALIDLQMPLMSGLDATAAIRHEFPNARIIILTTYSGDIQASRALKMGVSGYLLKSMLRAQMIEAIRVVHAGQRFIPQEIASVIAQHMSVDDLSPREIEVLRIVASGCSNKAVADRLFLSEDTIKSHMRSILSKLQANDRVHAVTIAMRRGFLEGNSLPDVRAARD